MENTRLTDLPDEMLEKIFSYLRFKNLLNITLVCKRFNDIFSTTKFMKNVKFRWTDNFEVRISRKYNSLSIKSYIKSASYFEDFLVQQMPFLTCLEFSYCEFKSSEFGRIIDKIKGNLEEAFFRGVDFWSDVIAAPLNFAKLKTISFIWCDECFTVIDFFKNASTVQKLCYKIDIEQPMNVEKVQKFSQFLVTLDGLKDLQLDFCNLSHAIFRDSYFTNAARCKLDKLAVTISQSHEYDLQMALENFCAFINKQREYLKELELIEFSITTELLDFILSVEGLKKLSLIKTKFENFQKSHIVNRSIERLKIAYFGYKVALSFDIGICNTLRSCSALKTLQLNYFEPSENMCTTIVNCLKHLSCLIFDIRSMEPITFPTVTSMEIFVSDPKKLLSLLQVNRQLKHIKIWHGIQKECSALAEVIDKMKIDVEYF